MQPPSGYPQQPGQPYYPQQPQQPGQPYYPQQPGQPYYPQQQQPSQPYYPPQQQTGQPQYDGPLLQGQPFNQGQVQPGQQYYPPQQQQMYGMPQGNMQMQAPFNVTVNVTNKGHGFLTRVIWYLFAGWWLGGLCLYFGYLCCLTIVLLPLGLVMLNRLPAVMTLRSAEQKTSVIVNNGGVTVNVGGTQQTSFLLRVLYFVFVGWWAGFFWASLGYLMCLSIILLPIGLMMLNRLPLVLTLRQN